ncbi:unnamed protein product [Ostreobium quekettii]|uniref:Uncharacterized protein n=1 Tax=Ostreobium quekettii TaxID=121088 RepID=A0A8S1IXM4_9CHLO|nr:unnamed protein product [Ostreobium quekettii]
MSGVEHCGRSGKWPLSIKGVERGGDAGPASLVNLGHVHTICCELDWVCIEHVHTICCKLDWVYTEDMCHGHQPERVEPVRLAECWPAKGTPHLARTALTVEQPMLQQCDCPSTQCLCMTHSSEYRGNML